MNPEQIKMLEERAVRREKRLAKRRLYKMGRKIKKGSLKKQIVNKMGKVDALLNGFWCRIHGKGCQGELAYHIYPQQLGDAAKFLQKNVVWACRGANEWERRNRGLKSDERHERIFGKEFIEQLKIEVRKELHLGEIDLLEMRSRLDIEINRLTNIERIK